MLACILSSCSSRYKTGRSPLRKQDTTTPTITTRWEDDTDYYSRSSSYYEKYPLFEVFDKTYFDAHKLSPNSFIVCNDNSIISEQQVSLLIEYLLKEIYVEKKDFRDFIVLQKKNFNKRKKCGLIVLRFKKYPLVLKLFMETPETFIDPYCKGVEPITFFFMAGGSNRHISGFTRISNLEYVTRKLQDLPQWSVHLPQKWFWESKNNRYIEVTGTFMHDQKKITTLLPSTYAIIADAIELKENHRLSNKERNEMIMNLCTDLNFYLDPHSDNYIITQNKGNHTIHVLDTEHFPSMVGIRNKVSFKSHIDWLFYLTQKFTIDTFFKLKSRDTNKKYPYKLAMT